MAKVTKTKDAACVTCGVSIQINVLASLKTAKCPSCKTGGKPITEVHQSEDVNTYGEKMTGPRIDGKPNKALARLACPYHPHQQMDIIGVIRNDHWGDIVSLQCRERGCWTLVQISEQSRKTGPWRSTVDGTSYEPDDVIEHVRTGNMGEWAKNHDVEQKHTKGL